MRKVRCGHRIGGDSQRRCLRLSGHAGPHRDKISQAAQRERNLLRRYGITAAEYDRMYAEQGGRCFICQVATGRSRRLAVDHDHETGRVRRLLCSRCNLFAGLADKDPGVITRLAELTGQAAPAGDAGSPRSSYRRRQRTATTTSPRP